MNATRLWWRACGRWKYPLALLCLLAVALFFSYDTINNRFVVGRQWVEHGSQTLGASPISVRSKAPAVPGRSLLLSFKTPVARTIDVSLGANSEKLSLVTDEWTPVRLDIPRNVDRLRLTAKANEAITEWQLGAMLIDPEPSNFK